MNFPETLESIRRLPPNRRQMSGGHIQRREETGRVGNVAPDAEFVHGQHGAADINPLSYMTELTGKPYVHQRQPGRQFSTNIIVGDVEKSDDSRIVAQKQLVVRSLGNMLFRDLAQTADSVRVFVTDDTYLTDGELSVARPKVLKTDDEIAEVCRRGLSVMIGDFARLRGADDDMPFSPDFAVKVDHILDRQIPSNIGVLALNGGYEVDTTHAGELAIVNSRLADINSGVVDKLEQSNTSVVGVVVDNQFPKAFDVAATDKLLAGAVSNRSTR